MVALTVDNMTAYEVDAMIARKDSTTTVYLTVTGNDVVSQPRHRLRRFASRYIMFDPASKQKKEIREKISMALASVGAELPVHGRGVRTKVSVTFYVRSILKDVDNMLKFIMDAMSRNTVYRDDYLVFIVDRSPTCNHTQPV